MCEPEAGRDDNYESKRGNFMPSSKNHPNCRKRRHVLLFKFREQAFLQSHLGLDMQRIKELDTNIATAVPERLAAVLATALELGIKQKKITTINNRMLIQL